MLVNAIDSMMRFCVLSRPSSLVVGLVVFCFLIVAAGAYAKFQVAWATITCTVVVAAVLVPLSSWLFKYGIWLDFALPLLGVQCHALYDLLKHSRGNHATAAPSI